MKAIETTFTSPTISKRVMCSRPMDDEAVDSTIALRKVYFRGEGWQDTNEPLRMVRGKQTLLMEVRDVRTIRKQQEGSSDGE